MKAKKAKVERKRREIKVKSHESRPSKKHLEHLCVCVLAPGPCRIAKSLSLPSRMCSTATSASREGNSTFQGTTSTCATIPPLTITSSLLRVANKRHDATRARARSG